MSKNKDPKIEDMKDQIFDEIHDDVVTKIKNDLNSQFGSQYRDEIKERVSNEIIDDIKEKVKKEEIRTSRRKSFKIFRLYIYLFLMIGVAIYLLYTLYNNDKINIYSPVSKEDVASVVNNVTASSDTSTTTVTTTRSQEWYIEQYGHLLTDYNITNVNLVKNGFTIESMSNEDRLGFVLDNLNDEDINVESIIYTVGEKTISDKFTELFGGNYSVTAGNFSHWGLDFAYSSNSQMYVAVGEKKTDNKKIIYNIKNIASSDNAIVITANVGVLVDDNIYNVNDLDTALGVYYNDITNYVDSLSSVKFVYKYIESNYYLDSILVG